MRVRVHVRVRVPVPVRVRVRVRVRVCVCVFVCVCVCVVVEDLARGFPYRVRLGIGTPENVVFFIDVRGVQETRV